MRTDIAIVGGGAIGLACAWRLAQAGAEVAVFESRDFGRGASWAAAGMLAAQCEAAHHPPAVEDESTSNSAAMFTLCRASRALFPDFAAELHEVTGMDVELSLNGSPLSDWRRPGILYIANAEDSAPIRFHEQHAAGYAVQEIEPNNALELSGTAATIPTEGHCFWLPEEGQVENRQLVRALREAARHAGVALYAEEPVHRVEVLQGRVTQLTTAHCHIECDQVLLCAGAWSQLIEGLPSGCVPPVRPVAGQMLALRPRVCPSAILYGSDVYLVPRRDGRLLVGATVEEVGFRTENTTKGIESLLRAAHSLLPAMQEYSVEAQWCGLRPGTPDGMPILGRTSLSNLFVATGHFRNGILLTPVTAQLMADCLLCETEPPTAFRLDRFFRD